MPASGLPVDEFPITAYAIFGLAEAVVLLLVLVVFLLVRSRLLSRRVGALRAHLKKSQKVPEAVGFDHHLSEAIAANLVLVDELSASDDVHAQDAGRRLGVRTQFLELELAAQAVADDPEQFPQFLAAGIDKLVATLRPVVEAPVPAGAAAQAAPSDDSGEVPPSVDTHEQEFDCLKRVINNQQDVMNALRAELEGSKADVQDVDSILRRLDELQHHDAGLQQCLNGLEQANRRLHVSAGPVEENGDHAPGVPPPRADAGSDDDNERLAVRVQELEALVELKDAAMQALEKQHSELQASYRELNEVS